MSEAQHLSDLVLDRILLGEDVGAARAHLENCVECRARLEALDRTALEFRKTAPIPMMAARTRRRLNAKPRMIFSSLGALAAAAIVLLFLARPDDPDVRLKGGVALSVYRQRDPAAESLLPHARVRPGDVLRFGVKTPRAGFAAVASIDGAGVVTIYAPPGPELEAIAAGKEQILDGTVELDATLGTERLIALVCKDKLRTGEVRDAIARARIAGKGDDAEHAVGGCATTSFSLDKVAR